MTARAARHARFIQTHKQRRREIADSDFVARRERLRVECLWCGVQVQVRNALAVEEKRVVTLSGCGVGRRVLSFEKPT